MRKPDNNVLTIKISNKKEIYMQTMDNLKTINSL